MKNKQFNITPLKIWLIQPLLSKLAPTSALMAHSLFLSTQGKTQNIPDITVKS